MLVFQGKNFWRMQEQGQPLEGYPVEIGKFWTGLPSKIDAAYERYDGKLVFLKGEAKIKRKDKEHEKAVQFHVLNGKPPNYENKQWRKSTSV